MGFNILGFEDPQTIEIKRRAYIDGYQQAVKDMQERLKNLFQGSELLTVATTISSQKMVDVTVPERIYKALDKAVENQEKLKEIKTIIK